jgi:DNA-binding GntR family transcriptional regulator
VGFIDDIVNHNVEHRLFLYFVFESPIFRVERTSYSAGSRSVDYERLHYRGDLARFVNASSERFLID